MNQKLKSPRPPRCVSVNELNNGQLVSIFYLLDGSMDRWMDGSMDVGSMDKMKKMGNNGSYTRRI